MASSNRVVLEARDLCFRYRGDADFGLKHIDVEIRSARCLAFVGFNAQGKSTLCRILGKVAPPRLQARKPDRGRILYFPRSSFACIDPYASTLTSSSLIALSLSALLAFGCLHRYAPNPWSTAVAMLAKPWTVSPFVLAVPVLTAYAIDKLRRMQRDSQYRSRVVYVPRRVELHPQNLAKHLAMTGHLSWALTSSERDALAERLLTWSGFRASREDDEEIVDPASVLSDATFVCGALSGGQRHLVYFLRALAPVFVASLGRSMVPQVDVLLLDEAFNCLDTEVRPRVIRLVRHAIDNCGVACVVVNQIMHEIAVLCEDAVFVHDGEIVDRANVKEMIATDGNLELRQADCRRYVEAYWSLERDMRSAAGKSRILPECGDELRRTISALKQLHAHVS